MNIFFKIYQTQYILIFEPEDHEIIWNIPSAYFASTNITLKLYFSLLIPNLHHELATIKLRIS